MRDVVCPFAVCEGVDVDAEPGKRDERTFLGFEVAKVPVAGSCSTLAKKLRPLAFIGVRATQASMRLKQNSMQFVPARRAVFDMFVLKFGGHRVVPCGEGRLEGRELRPLHRVVLHKGTLGRPLFAPVACALLHTAMCTWTMSPTTNSWRRRHVSWFGKNWKRDRNVVRGAAYSRTMQTFCRKVQIPRRRSEQFSPPINRT